MAAGVEWIVGTLRAGPEYKTFGDPYTFSCTIVVRNNTVELIGASGTFSKEVYQAIHECLAGMGFDAAIWDRKKGAKTLNKKRHR